MADAEGRPLPTLGKSPFAEELQALLKRAEGGDESTLPMLRELFDADPGTFRSIDMAVEARDAILKPAAGRNVATRELLSRRIDEVAAELAGPAPTSIERLLADRAALCWHLVNAYERTYAAAEGLSIKQADYQQRRIDASHKRYLSALKTLATVRKLAVPALQINLAREQVNIAGAG